MGTEITNLLRYSPKRQSRKYPVQRLTRRGRFHLSLPSPDSATKCRLDSILWLFFRFVRCQNFRRAPNCMVLGLFCCPLTTPKAVELMLVLGGENCTRLNVLNASARSSTFMFSKIVVFLIIDMAQSSIPGSNSVGTSLGALPNVKGALKLNWLVSKNLLSRLVTGPLRVGFLPVQFGRPVPSKLPLPLPPEI
jgi:hypothetical protein